MATINQKIAREIERLKEEKARFEKKLKAKKEFNKSAWNEYGSELCAASLERAESDIQTSINRVSNHINLLTEYLEGKIDLEKTKILSKKIKDINDEIQKLETKKSALRKELDKLGLVEILLLAI
ncbi:MAG: hypothetical protein Q7S12_01985 [bacterium]|nr:hypothetical protein [bacterium]